MYAALAKEFGGTPWEWKRLPNREIMEYEEIRRTVMRLRKMKTAEAQAQQQAGALW